LALAALIGQPEFFGYVSQAKILGMGKSEQAFRKLKEHRESAATYPLDVLVWGPSEDGSIEYETRRALRDKLVELGYNARFSEDLCEDPEALRDPLDDEFLQATAAHVIIMIYGSRGTQTERDMILTKDSVAAKAIIFVEETLSDVVRKSLAGQSWRRTSDLAKVILYKRSELPDGILEEACDLLQEMRKTVYVRDLRNGDI
jgi:hypothetical protein